MSQFLNLSVVFSISFHSSPQLVIWSYLHSSSQTFSTETLNLLDNCLLSISFHWLFISKRYFPFPLFKFAFSVLIVSNSVPVLKCCFYWGFHQFEYTDFIVSDYFIIWSFQFSTVLAVSAKSCSRYVIFLHVLQFLIVNSC